MDYEKKYKEALKRASGFKTQEYKDVAAHIFPELQESEDEKIRKAIIKYLSALDDDEIRYGVSFKDMRAWLEKQGEKGIVFRDTFGYEEGRQKGQEEGIMLVLDNPQKYGLEKQGEQKPCGGDVNDEALQKQLEIWFEKGKCSGKDEVINHPENFGLQKLAEWTEKDEINRDLIYNALNHVYDLEHNKSLCDWLNSLKPNHWKPTEWSEEDEKTFSLVLKNLYMLLDNAKGCSADWVFYLTNAIKFIKSLKARVQLQKQEWSYNDEIIIETIIQEIEKIPSEKFIDNAKDRCLDWLRYRTKSLKPHPQWKPSDEQMKALNEAIYHVDDSIATQIAMLIGDLKKL